MQAIEAQIQELFTTTYPGRECTLTKLPQSGSDRIYYRLNSHEDTFIATYNINKKENKTFIAFSKHFKNLGLPVPEIYAASNDNNIYIQQDFGTQSLLDNLEMKGYTTEMHTLFQQSLKQLARLQIQGHQGMDYSICLTAREFGRQAIMSDLLYFKYYFLDTLKLPYDKQALMIDFENISTFLSQTEQQYFMFRDFQSRNIMVQDGNVFFIDYQGGMQGALQYDVASLLWQARAQLSAEWKKSLLEYYMEEADKLLPQPLQRALFTDQYNGYVLLRLLQVLGAYGFRGLFERKAHFLTSIPLALKNLQWFVGNALKLGIEVPEFVNVLQAIANEDIISRFETIKATDVSRLVVTINSFSYKRGIPADETVNGGGFVFDCRGLLNPGRFTEYKTLSGQDKPVQTFLEQRTKMAEFLTSVNNLVDISVEDYLKRGFDSLMVNFGCTGGQHRSVYAAEQTARHLRNKYKVKVQVNHGNQHNWVKILEAAPPKI